MAKSDPAAAGRIFVSYRREETAYPAGWLFDRLSEYFSGGQIFKDVDSIELGDDFIEMINTAVGSCDVLLALIGDQWLTITDEDGRRRLDDPDDFVRLEIEAALARKVRVIPILIDGARMPHADELPPSLAKLVRRQALDLSPSRFDFDTSRLIKVLEETLAEVQTRSSTEESQVVEGAREPVDHQGPRSTTRGPGPAARRRGLGWAVAALAALMAAALVLAGVRIWGSGSILLASFETGTEGWVTDEPVSFDLQMSQASDFATDGSFSLQIDTADEVWVGRTFLTAKDLTGKSSVSVDLRILEVETPTGMAVQFDEEEWWCQSAWGSAEPGTEVTVTLDLATAKLQEGPGGSCDHPPGSDLRKLKAVWVYLGEGSFQVDNLRVE